MLDRSQFTKVLIESCPSNINEDYCCHAYSLQVHKDADILRFHNEIFVDLVQNGRTISCPFYNYLFKRKLIKNIIEKQIQNDDIILYVDSKRSVKHSGRIQDGRVISKWGGRARNPNTGEVLLGNDLWLHQWEDVPYVYTDGGKLSALLYRISPEFTSDDIKTNLLAFRESILPGLR